ncbi:MAG: glutathione binding-like protein, partial [Sneathiella sp.]
ICSNFTVADLNVATCLSWARIGRLDVVNFPNLDNWLSKCFERPAYLKLRNDLRKNHSAKAK